MMITSLLQVVILGQTATTLFPIEEKGKWGFIDARGAKKIQPQFLWAGNFSDGSAAVARKRNGFVEYCLIDSAGRAKINWSSNLIFGPIRGRVLEYRNFVAEDNDGNTRFQFREYKTSGKQQSLSWKSVVEIFEGGDYHPVHEWNEDLSRSFDDKVMPFQIVEHGNGYLNGNDEAFTSIDRSLKVQDKNGDGISQWVKNGIGVGPRMSGMDIDAFGSDGMFPIKGLREIGGPDVGFMNSKGKVIITPRFYSVTPFVGGLSRFSAGQYWGYVNKAGKVVWRSRG